MKVYEAASAIGCKNSEVIDYLSSHGHKVTTAVSVVPDDMLPGMLEYFSGLQSGTEEIKQDTEDDEDGCADGAGMPEAAVPVKDEAPVPVDEKERVSADEEPVSDETVRGSSTEKRGEVTVGEFAEIMERPAPDILAFLAGRGYGALTEESVLPEDAMTDAVGYCLGYRQAQKGESSVQTNDRADALSGSVRAETDDTIDIADDAAEEEQKEKKKTLWRKIVYKTEEDRLYEIGLRNHATTIIETSPKRERPQYEYDPYTGEQMPECPVCRTHYHVGDEACPACKHDFSEPFPLGERFKEKYPDPDDYQAERYFCYRCGLAYETKFPECPRCGAEHPLPMHRYDWEMRQRASIAPNVNYCPECAHIYESNDYMCPFCKTLRINEMPYTITEHESESGEMYRVIRWDSIYYLDLLHWLDVNHPFIDPIIIFGKLDGIFAPTASDPDGFDWYIHNAAVAYWPEKQVRWAVLFHMDEIDESDDSDDVPDWRWETPYGPIKQLPLLNVTGIGYAQDYKTPLLQGRLVLAKTFPKAARRSIIYDFLNDQNYEYYKAKAREERFIQHPIHNYGIDLKDAFEFFERDKATADSCLIKDRENSYMNRFGTNTYLCRAEY